MPVALVQECVSSTEFVEWMVVLDEQDTEPSRADYRAASIVQAVSRVLHKNPKKVKLKDCLVRWERQTEGETPDQGELTEHQEQQLELRAQQSKAFWGALAGVEILQ
jgi:hypothetical protein